jgi:D-lyxose ketol-isomerase
VRRSQINSAIGAAEAFFTENGVALPPFASWGPERWRSLDPTDRELVECRLGWDVTDFGSGDFAHTGLCLLTLRNGRVGDMERGHGETYAEKVMYADKGQVTPLHSHWRKTEDIIVRGSAGLAVRLYGSTEDEDLSDVPTVAYVDGMRRTLTAVEVLELRPEESIMMPSRTYQAVGGRTTMGGVVCERRPHRQSVPPALGRFPPIEEDELSYRVLVGDYA